MIEYSKYNNDNGEIIQYGIMQNELFEKEEHIVAGAYRNTDFYISDGVAVPRPEFTLPKLELTADGTDSIFVSDLPIPFTVEIDGEQYEIDDGIFEFKTTVPGIYKISAATFPYKNNIIEVTAI